MPKGYWLARVDVANPDAYKAYVAANAEPFGKFKARFLVRGGAFKALEGTARTRNVVIEFPSFQAARACWDSPEYQRAKALREGHASGEIVAVEGQDAPPLQHGTAPRGYWIGRVDVTDPEAYKAYVAADAEAFAKYGARFLVRGGRYEALEGQSRARNLLIAFADKAAALACYRSDEYQRAKRLREGNAHFDLIVIEGYEGPQPG